MSGFFARLERRMLSTPLSAFFFTFACIVTLRNVLEIYADGSTMDPRQFVDFSLFYLALGLSLLLLLRLLAGVRPELALRAVLLGMCIVVMPPLVDMLATAGRGFNIGYVNPRSWSDALWKLLTFWEGLRFDRATLGIKIEVALASLATALWVRHHTGKWRRGLLAGLLVYLLIFTYSILPWLAIQAWSLLGAAPRRMLIHQRTLMFTILTLTQLVPVLAWTGGRGFTAMCRNLRLTRMAHFLVMPLLGMALAGGARFNHWRGVDCLWFYLAMTAAMIYLTIQNDIADSVIDRVANPERPLSAGAIPLPLYRRMGHVFLGAALLLGLLAGFRLLLYTAAFIAIYTLYSAPPLRLKRVPVFSKLLIAANTLLMVLAGYDFAGGNLRQFSAGYIFLFLIIYGVLINFIDLKDAAGDRAAGIPTLPVILGLRTAQWTMAALFTLFYPLVALAVGDLRLLWACVPAGLLSAAVSLSRSYGSRHDRAIILISLGVIVVAFLLGLPHLA
ncbi:MAG: UbiA family prenyltransferase [Candidatus Cloacimonetes bacterium]|nr:UbiA family prenyltransferase [Candidatus Cloacimonadota bacterium]